jgi:F-type H+-transporting ATPase subunit b
VESILSTFGIDWRLLLVNMVNFGVLLVGLWYFLYGPVMQMLDERKQKVAEGVDAAEQAKNALADIEKGRDAKLAQAAQEADDVVARARAAGAAKEKELREQAQRQAESLLKDAQIQAAELKSKALAESKQEVAKLIVLGMEKGLTK